MAKNVGNFSLYLDLHIDTKNSIRQLQGLEANLRGQVNKIFASLNKDNLGAKLDSNLENVFGRTTVALGNTGSQAGLSFGSAVLAGITSILTSSAVLGILDKAFGQVKDFVAQSFKAGIETEKQGIAFRVLLGDPEKAKKLFRDINNLAVKTPFDIAEIREITKRLLGYGFAVEEVIDVTRMLGDITAGTGGDFKLLAKAYGQVRTLGRVYAEELNQFAEQGVALRELLAKNRGITVEELVRGMHSGKIVIPFEEFKKVFEDLYKSRFMNLMAEQADTLGGRLQNLSETLSLLGQELIGIDTLTGRVKEGSLFDLVSQGLVKLLDFIREHSDEIQDFFSWAAKELAQPFKDLGISAKDVFSFLKSLVPLFGSLLRLGVIFLKISFYFNSFLSVIKASTIATENLKKSVQKITDVFPEELKKIGEIITNLKTAFKNLFSPEGTFEDFLNQMKQVFKDVSVLYLDFFSKKEEIWQTFFDFFVNQASQMLNWFLGAFGLSLDTLPQKFSVTFNNLWNTLSNWLVVVYTALNNAFTKFTTWFKTGFEIIIQIIKTNLSDFLITAKNWFLNFASPAFWFGLGIVLGQQLGEGLRAAFLSAMESIRSEFIQVINQLGVEIKKTVTSMNNLQTKFKLPSFNKLPGFASGGSFIVDGKPGIDKNLVAFWATKGERVIIQTPQEQNIDNRQYIQKTIIYTTQSNQFVPIFMQ